MAKINQINVGVVGVGWVGGIRATAVKKNPIVDQLYIAEIDKKSIFQGKPLDDDTKFHIKRELGDIMWYWINSCRAMGLDPNEVIDENVNKLKARYPGGEFDVHYSENRKQGDL